MIKIVALLTRSEQLSHEEFIRRWVDHHAPLALAVEGIRKYVVCPVDGTLTRPDIPSQGVGVDGIAELWFDNRDSMHSALDSPDGKALTNDGVEFIGRIEMFICDELPII